MRDNAVADIELLNLPDLGNGSNVPQRESVSRGYMQPILGRQRSTFAQASQLLIRAHRALAVNSARAQRRLGVGGSAQLNLLGVYFATGFDLVRIGIDEQTRDNA